VKHHGFITGGVLLCLLFVITGFDDGWAAAARQILAFSYAIVLMCVAMFVVAASLRVLSTDRTFWILSALATALGIMLHVLGDARIVYYMSLLGASCGAITGLGVRFGMSPTGRRLERSERRMFRRLLKRFRSGGRSAGT
jgi:hypothetical protein